MIQLGLFWHNLRSVFYNTSITSTSKQFVRHDTAERVSSRILGMEDGVQF